jgi:hypothetical protein|tara:strand:+ start:996 stop:1133 length:138 start_codon:yes stop_codon:yes gene_type:complete
MAVEKIIEMLRQALESKDWDLVRELIETLQYEGEGDDFSDYFEDE